MNKKTLILDTMLVSNIMKVRSQEAYLIEISKLLPDYKLAVTMFTQYELLKSSDRKHQLEIIKYLSENYSRIDLNEEVINFSARIFNLYKKHASTKGYKITDGDIINGAITIALPDCHIMTIDNNDYPRPFFKDISRIPISYTSNSKKVTVDMTYILAPDLDNLKNCAQDLEI